jgi:hypothetical protein
MKTPCIDILNKNVIFLKQKQRTGRQNRSYLEDMYQWAGEDVRKGCGRGNMVKILCTHVYKWKNETC